MQRLRPPNWSEFPPAARYGELYGRNQQLGVEACRLGARLIGEELDRVGINCDCLPVLDLAHPGRHAVIGDRAYSGDPETVAALGRAACEGLLEAGVLPVIKHIPGHGRAAADSHVELPRVDAELDDLQATDFVPFRRLNDMPMAMTAHILFTALDAERPATLSADIIERVIRGKIGFDGLLMSDDVSMKALAGSIADRCAGLFAAGCDLALHCNGEMDEMVEVASAAPDLAGRAAERAEAALGRLQPPRPLEVAQARSRLDALMSGVA